MQDVNQNKINVFLPKAACIFIIIVYFFYCYLIYTEIGIIISIFVGVIGYHIYIYYCINKGI